MHHAALRERLQHFTRNVPNAAIAARAVIQLARIFFDLRHQVARAADI